MKNSNLVVCCCGCCSLTVWDPGMPEVSSVRTKAVKLLLFPVLIEGFCHRPVLAHRVPVLAHRVLSQWPGEQLVTGIFLKQACLFTLLLPLQVKGKCVRGKEEGSSPSGAILSACHEADEKCCFSEEPVKYFCAISHSTEITSLLASWQNIP